MKRPQIVPAWVLSADNNFSYLCSKAPNDLRLLWPIIIQINEHVHTTIHVVTGVPVKISVNVQAASRGSEVQSGATKMGVGQKVRYTIPEISSRNFVKLLDFRNENKILV